MTHVSSGLDPTVESMWTATFGRSVSRKLSLAWRMQLHFLQRHTNRCDVSNETMTPFTIIIVAPTQ
jgi:hypothetical protein